MKNLNPFSEFPEQICASTEQPHLWYVRLPGHYAIHGKVPEHLRKSVIQYLGDRSIAVCRGESNSVLMSLKSLVITPIYSLEPNGPPAVPTGLVYVRFRDDVRSQDQQQSLASLGYVITQTPGYAPHTAWVCQKSNEIAESLAKIPALETLFNVVNVEPQMLTKPTTRVGT